MTSLARVLLLGLLLGLSGCAVHGSAPTSQLPMGQGKAHPRFAPPPGGPSHWDAGLGVYVLDNAPDLYYRERTYYRWNRGWNWASNPQGPWQPTDSSGVPAGLGRRYGH